MCRGCLFLRSLCFFRKVKYFLGSLVRIVEERVGLECRVY